MLIVGLTGGIGSGKSTVARLLGELGAEIVDVDAVGRAVIAPGGRAEAGVLAEFGEPILAPDGSIDRRALARVVFEHPDGLARLEAISHPAINAELTAVIGTLPAGWRSSCTTWRSSSRATSAGPTRRTATATSSSSRRRWSCASSGPSPGGWRRRDARARAAAQATDEQRRAVADAVVRNDADLAALEAGVLELWTTITSWITARQPTPTTP